MQSATYVVSACQLLDLSLAMPPTAAAHLVRIGARSVMQVAAVVPRCRWRSNHMAQPPAEHS
jgi:hypothetical protein